MSPQDILMTVYSYFLVSASGDGPHVEASGHDGDERAISHAEAILSRKSDLCAVEVWDGPLRLAYVRREDLLDRSARWRELLYP